MTPQEQIVIIKRESMPARTHVQVDDGVVDIGELRDFSRNDVLRDLIAANDAGTAFAWTTLQPGQTLAAHKHPVASMILVCEGRGRYFGEFDAELAAGDIVYVKSNALHGFQAAADSTLHCLSVQFEGRGLYESADRSLVRFGNASRYDALLAASDRWKTRFVELCAVIRADANRHGEAFSAALFGYVSRWSTQFQHILFLRQVHTSCPQISGLFREHLVDEFGHDAFLANYSYQWDAQLEAYFGWFLNQMYTRADAAKLIIVHMVLESAGDIFSEHMSSTFKGKVDIADYVSLHGALDGGHANMGADIVQAYCFSHPDDAERACEDGWRMFIEMFSRIHGLTLERLRQDGAAAAAAEAAAAGGAGEGGAGEGTDWGLGTACAGFELQRIDAGTHGLDFVGHVRTYCEQVTGLSLQGIAIEDFHRHVPMAMQLPNDVNLNACTHRADAESDPALFADFARLLLHLSEEVIGEDLVFEARPAVRLHFPVPCPDNYRLPGGEMACFHNDMMFGEPAEQINCWLSVSRCQGSAGLQVAGLADSCRVLRRFVAEHGLTRGQYNESRQQFFDWMHADADVHRFVEAKMRPLVTVANELVLFDPVTLHGTAENAEDATRASIDFRILRVSDYERFVAEAARAGRSTGSFDDMELVRGDYYHRLTIREYAAAAGLGRYAAPAADAAPVGR